jgi:hypothetical protein
MKENKGRKPPKKKHTNTRGRGVRGLLGHPEKSSKVPEMPDKLKKPHLVGWKTQDEIEFIDGLGTFRDSGMTTSAKEAILLATPGRRKKLLEGYIQSLASRQVWGTIDKYVVLGYATEKLKEATRP